MNNDFNVVIERDSQGYYVASVPSLRGCHTQAKSLDALMDRPVDIVGEEAETALLSNPAAAVEALGAPPTPLDTVLRWTAHWLQHGGSTLGKPAHFNVRDGRF